MRYLAVIAACLLTLLITLPAPAEADLRPEECVEGYVTQLGYTYHGGYWYKGGIQYTRSFQWYTDYSYSCGRYCPYQTWRAIYTPVTVINVAPAPVLKYSNNWQVEYFRSLSKRDDLVAFGNAAHELTATAIQPNYSPYGGSLYNGYGVSGQTLYARGGFNAFTQSLYSTADENLSNMLAARLTQNAQQLAGQGHSDFLTRIDAQSAYAAGLEKMRIVANAGQPTPTLTANSFKFDQGVQNVSPPAAPSPPAPAAEGLTMESIWNDPGPDGCIKCHSGASAQKGMTLQKWQKLSRSDAIAHWNAHLSPELTDPKVIMPRDDKGVGHVLPFNKLKVIHENIDAKK